MGLQDYTYRLKAQSGDTTPHDELSVSGDLSGGTITLVDMGSGDYAWQFANGLASVSVPSKLLDMSEAASGVTMAFRVAITDYGADFSRLVAWSVDAGSGHGVLLSQVAANQVRGTYSGTISTTTATQTVNTSIKTYVLRFSTASADKLYFWMEGLTGSGDTADSISAGEFQSDATIDNLCIAGTSITVRVSDLVLWAEELSDADCHALAENGIRATLDAASPTITLTDPVAVVTGSTASCTITRSEAASGNITYNLTSSATGIATVPATATILDGTSSISFNITGVSAGSSTITATNAADSGETDTATANVSALKGLTVTFGQANLSGLTFAWFDEASPDLFAAPTVVGTTESTDGSGVLEIDLTGTSVAVGNTGFLLIYKAGATAPDDIAFFGRLTVQDIG